MDSVNSYQDIGLHNVAALEPAEGGGMFLRRFPRDVRDAISPLGQMVSQEAAGVELRFVTDSPNFRVSLSTQPFSLWPYEEHNQDLVIFRGAYFHSHHRLKAGTVNHVNVVNIDQTNPFDALAPDARDQCGFSHRVWRVMLGRYPATLHGLETYGRARRPPTADEVPSRRWIAYGSSITNGAAATVHHNAYIYHAAHIAGLDVCNQGLSGSCLCEPEMARYLAGRDDWDIATLELGVNMRQGFTPEQFAERAASLVDAICRKHPKRQVVLITIYPNAATEAYTADPHAETSERQRQFDAILRQLADRTTRPNVTLIEGADILDRFADLSIDMIHPSDYGHARMGANLGERLRALSSTPTATPAP